MTEIKVLTKTMTKAKDGPRDRNSAYVDFNDVDYARLSEWAKREHRSIKAQIEFMVLEGLNLRVVQLASLPTKKGGK